jgi:hypothetical protein
MEIFKIKIRVPKAREFPYAYVVVFLAVIAAGTVETHSQSS